MTTAAIDTFALREALEEVSSELHGSLVPEVTTALRQRTADFLRSAGFDVKPNHSTGLWRNKDSRVDFAALRNGVPVAFILLDRTNNELSQMKLAGGVTKGLQAILVRWGERKSLPGNRYKTVPVYDGIELIALPIDYRRVVKGRPKMACVRHVSPSWTSWRSAVTTA